MKKIFLCLVVLLLTISCEDAKFTVDRINIKNSSSHKIQYFIARPGAEFVYPDTLLPTLRINSVVINSGETFYGDSGDDWQKTYNNLPENKMSVFILHPDTLNSYTWEEIRQGYKILKRYDLTLEELKTKNFVLTYEEN